jgi:hypothetical protein
VTSILPSTKEDQERKEQVGESCLSTALKYAEEARVGVKTFVILKIHLINKKITAPSECHRSD